MFVTVAVTQSSEVKASVSPVGAFAHVSAFASSTFASRRSTFLKVFYTSATISLSVVLTLSVGSSKRPLSITSISIWSAEDSR